MVVKGAPDLILQRCTATYDDPGSRVLVDLEIIRAAYTSAINSLGWEGQRVLVMFKRSPSLPALSSPPGHAFSSDPEVNQ